MADEEPTPAAEDVAPEADVADVGLETNGFVQLVESLAGSLPQVMFAVRIAGRTASERFDDFAKQFGTVTDQDEGGTTYSFKPPYHVRAARLGERRSQAETAGGLIPRVFVLALVGQFDAFVGRLLRSLFLLRPELIESSERSLTFAQLVGLGTIDNAREFLLEKEIETVLRKSHADQFVWMETKFGITLRKDLPSWPTFIELTERRNLFAHTNGVVSDQYIAVCREHGAAVSEACCRGTQLSVNPEYFNAAFTCVFEIGVKLAQVLWRKLAPGDLDQADMSLIDVTFNLIVARRYDLAIQLLDFGCCTLKKHASDQNRKILQINRAQAHKWKGEPAACKEVLATEDWSACRLAFQLALTVLDDDFKGAATLMRTIGNNGDQDETTYQEWPLFQEFRQSDDFATAYHEVFGEPFVHIEKTLREGEREKQREGLEALAKTLEEDLAVGE